MLSCEVSFRGLRRIPPTGLPPAELAGSEFSRRIDKIAALSSTFEVGINLIIFGLGDF